LKGYNINESSNSRAEELHGMLAGISASNGKNEVIILEKMNSLGRKLKITGKGRCNITNDADMSEFISNIPGNRKIFI